MMRAILAVAVPRNTRAQVSGALLACDKWFVQALEGDRLVVGEIYQKTCGDPRHHDTQVITAGPIGDRNFADWSMCGQTLSPTDDAIIHTLNKKKGFNPAGLSAQSALRLLEIVRSLQTRPTPVTYL